MDYRKNNLAVTARLAIAAMLLIAGTANADGGGTTCGVNCNGDILCSIQNLGTQIQCAFTSEFHAIAGGAINTMFNAIMAVTLSTPTFDDAATAFYQEIIIIAESILLVMLLLAGVKLMYSTMLSASERAEAKQEAQKTAVNMLLVGLSLPLYLLALDVTRTLAAGVGPTQSEFGNAVTASVFGSGFFMIVLVAALLVATIFALTRYVIAFASLFLLPFALVFESFWVTASIGRGLKLLVATNLVIQVLQALFLKLIVFAIASSSSLPPLDGAGALLTAVGMLAFGSWVTAKLYATAFEFNGPSVGRAAISLATGGAASALNAGAPKGLEKPKET